MWLNKRGLTLLEPQWPAPAQVRAVCTTRLGGVSEPPYQSLNLAGHVGDAVDSVKVNRSLLRDALALPSEPVWLQQVHGVTVLQAMPASPNDVSADASVSRSPGVVCVVMTADCLPVLICDRAGTVVGAAHAGWRGLLDGVIEQTVAAMAPVAPEDLLVWLGPAIGPQAFEVGEGVRAAFEAHAAEASAAFVPARPGHWFADLYALARQRLAALGISAVYGGDQCTYSDATHYFSYRRDTITGRMASLIWLDTH